MLWRYADSFAGMVDSSATYLKIVWEGFDDWTTTYAKRCIIFKRSDKCKGIVVMDKQTYIDKGRSITSEYEPTPKNPTPKLEAMTKIIILETMD